MKKQLIRNVQLWLATVMLTGPMVLGVALAHEVVGNPDHEDQAENGAVYDGLLVPSYGTLSREIRTQFDLAAERSIPLADLMQESFVHRETRRALVIYDDPNDDENARLGMMYAILLRNLIGHFPVDVSLMGISEYERGDTELYDAIFYMGTFYGNPLPESFLHDILGTERTVVWMRYNVEQLEYYDENAAIELGFSFVEYIGIPSSGAPIVERPPFYDTIFYKGLEFIKSYWLLDGEVEASYDPEMGIVRVVDDSMIKVEVGNSNTGEIRPYVIHRDSFWYIGDMPLAHMGPRDRYLVLADLLHDILGIQHEEQHLAMVRLEDLHFGLGPELINRTTDLLSSRDVPFGMAVVPMFVAASENLGGAPTRIAITDHDAVDFLQSIRNGIRRGGSVFMHGFTHQTEGMRNPYNGMTGSDFELWNSNVGARLERETSDRAYRRLRAGLEMMYSAGLEPIGFEAPLYESSSATYAAIADLFDVTYQRVTYFTDPMPRLATVTGQLDYYEDQFFPYVIHEDFYGQLVLPENLGNLQYSAPVQSVEYLVGNARYALAVRDGVASFFFHPYLTSVTAPNPAYNDLIEILDGIEDLGYEWASVEDVMRSARNAEEVTTQ